MSEKTVMMQFRTTDEFKLIADYIAAKNFHPTLSDFIRDIVVTEVKKQTKGVPFSVLIEKIRKEGFELRSKRGKNGK